MSTLSVLCKLTFIDKSASFVFTFSCVLFVCTSTSRGSRSSKSRVDSDGDDDSPRMNGSRNSANNARGNAANINQQGGGGDNLPSILVNATKNELKTLNNGYKSWTQKFRTNFRFTP